MLIQDSAVIIGNGESRSNLDLPSLKGLITLIGCNAVHRELRVDHLICCDFRMVQETIRRKKSRKIPVYTRERYYNTYKHLNDYSQIHLLPELPYKGPLKPDNPEHWGSGPYAALLSCHLKFKKSLFVGFDLYGKENLVNNIYKDTPNYLENSKPAVDPSYWIYQLRKLFLYFPEHEFVFFNYPEWKIPTDWQLPNVTVFGLEKFYIELDKLINISYNNKTVD